MLSPVRSFNKHFLNHLTRHLATLSFGPFAVVYHVGRKSGKPYETTIFAEPVPEGFVLALTYGPEVDWYRNISTARSCKIQWHGQIYELNQITALDPKLALATLPLFFRTVLGLVGFQDFIKLEGQSPLSA